MTLEDRVNNVSVPVQRVEVSVVIPTAIHLVWQAVTDIAHVQHWWASGSIDAREGGSIRLGDGNSVHGTIKICYAPYVFAFTWHDRPAQSEHPEWLVHETCGLVQIDLVAEAEQQTRLTLVQHNPYGNAAGAAQGWKELLCERLPAYLATR